MCKHPTRRAFRAPPSPPSAVEGGSIASERTRCRTKSPSAAQSAGRVDARRADGWGFSAGKYSTIGLNNTLLERSPLVQTPHPSRVRAPPSPPSAVEGGLSGAHCGAKSPPCHDENDVQLESRTYCGAKSPSAAQSAGRVDARRADGWGFSAGKYSTIGLKILCWRDLPLCKHPTRRAFRSTSLPAFGGGGRGAASRSRARFSPVDIAQALDEKRINSCETG